MHFYTIAMFIFAVYAIFALNSALPKRWRGKSGKTYKNNIPENAPDVNKNTAENAPGANKNTAENAPDVNKNAAENALDDGNSNPVSQPGKSKWKTPAKIGGGIAMAGGVVGIAGTGVEAWGVACTMGRCSATDANESDSSNHTASITSPEHNSYDIVNHISNNYYGKESAVDNLATRPSAPAFIFSLVLAKLFVKHIL